MGVAAPSQAKEVEVGSAKSLARRAAAYEMFQKSKGKAPDSKAQPPADRFKAIEGAEEAAKAGLKKKPKMPMMGRHKAPPLPPVPQKDMKARRGSLADEAQEEGEAQPDVGADAVDDESIQPPEH